MSAALSRASVIVGRRWVIDVIGALAHGPRRFSDLRDDVARISPNVLALRLRDLTARGIIGHRLLPPPAASAVYELTERGHGLVPVIDALERWSREVDDVR